MTSAAPNQRRVLVLGALSAIAQATCRRLAEDGAHLTLVARSIDRLNAVADDLRLRGAASVSVHVADLAHVEDHAGLIDDYAAQAEFDGFDAVLLFYGALGDHSRAEAGGDEIRRIIDVNFTSAVCWMNAAANHVVAGGGARPVVMAISSVAGDRGRRSNYVYGAAKGGLSVFMQGLAHRLAAQKRQPGLRPARAVSMKLGFVDTPMTDGIEKGGPLWASPDQVAQTIFKAVEHGGPFVYAPWFWRWIMLAIRVTPAFVFNKVNL